MNHECPPNPDLLAPLPPSPKVVIGDFPSQKAMVLLPDDTVYVDAAYARSLDEDSAQAVLWHEAAHLQSRSCARACSGKPNGCERCADQRLGACMFLAGFDEYRAKRALEGLNLNRQTLLTDAMFGYQYARQKTSPVVPTTGPSVGQYSDPNTEYVEVRPSYPTSPPPGASDEDRPATTEPTATEITETIVDATIDRAGQAVDLDCACRYDCGWIAAIAGATLAAMTVVVVVTVKP